MWKILALILLLAACARKPTQEEIYFNQLKDLTIPIEMREQRDLALYGRGFYDGCQTILHTFTYDFQMQDKGIAPHCLKLTKKVILKILKVQNPTTDRRAESFNL